MFVIASCQCGLFINDGRSGYRSGMLESLFNERVANAGDMCTDFMIESCHDVCNKNAEAFFAENTLGSTHPQVRKLK